MNPHSFAGGEHTTIPTGAEITIHYPQTSPPTASGMQDGWMKVTNFFNSINLSLASLGAGLVTLGARITTLENSTSKVVVENTGTFNFAVANSTVVEAFVFNWRSGTPSVKIGTTSGGTELSGMTYNLSETDKRVVITVWFTQSGESPTVYVNVSGGLVDCTRFQRLNVFTS